MDINQTGLSSGEVALIAASISAMTAFGAQFLTHYLSRRKEKKNLIAGLIADERRIAYLLTTYYKELVMHKVHKQYWYKTSELKEHSEEENKDSHKKHFESNQKSFETIAKINLTTSEYFKMITLYTILKGPNTIIAETLNEINTFQPRKASDFFEVDSYPELLEAQSIEEHNLNQEYLYYSQCFDKIHAEMN